ncbi:MAG: hypothetical protein H0Z29_04145 [Candidatus Marinimicrobia bacterium]|nr:hypothetical protein [Candidatus Neomarinimicrobiota bacterium]
MKRLILLSLSFLLTYYNCSTKLILRPITKFVTSGSTVIYKESDLVIAEQFIVTNIGNLQIFLSKDPDNEVLNLLMAQALCAYVTGFVEDYDTSRAIRLYNRAFKHALNALPPNLRFEESVKIPQFESILNNCLKKHIPALFWIGFSWSNLILHNLDDPTSLVNLAKVEMIMRKVESTYPEYNNGAVYLFFGAYYCSKPIMFGGNPELGKEYFEKCIKLNGKDYLLPKVYMARYYAVQMMDKELFNKLLNEVINTKTNNKEYNLMNAIAKRKARLFLEKEKLFFPEVEYE